MDSSRRAVLFLAALLFLLPARAGAQKLDADDKKFLADVHPISLLAEEASYKKLQDKADRLEFQKIFWARRDPDLGTPENEFQQQYLKDRAAADESYRLGTTPGSATDCGRTFILLGKPDQVEPRPGRGPTASEGGVRVPEVWVYRDRPDRRILGLKIMIGFDSECRADGDFAQQFPRIAATKIVHPNLDYKVDKDGHLAKLADQLPRDTQTRALLRQPRHDFALAFQPAYLRTAGGGTALLGLVAGEAGSLALADSSGLRTVEVSVGASAQAADGRQAAWAEQTMTAPVSADGRFLASFKMGLEPGKYTLQTGVLDLKGGKGSVVSTPIDVPDLSLVTSAADGSTMPQLTATVLVVKDIKEVAPDAPANAGPFAAFQLNTTQLIPVFASALRKSDAVTFFFQLYDLRLDAATGHANGSVRLKLMKDGALLNSSPETPVQTAVFSTGIGPIPLAGFQPGKYVVQIEASDRISQKTTTAQASFEIQP